MKTYHDAILEECKLDDIHKADPLDPRVRATLPPDVVAQILGEVGDKNLDAFCASYAGSHNSTYGIMGKSPPPPDSTAGTSGCWRRSGSPLPPGPSPPHTTQDADLIMNTAKFLMETAGPALALKQLAHNEHMKKIDESLSGFGNPNLNKPLRNRKVHKTLDRGSGFGIQTVDTTRYVRKDFSEDYIKNAQRVSIWEKPQKPLLPFGANVTWKTEEKDDSGCNFISWDGTQDTKINQWYGMGSKGRVYAKKMPKKETLRLDSDNDSLMDFDLIFSIHYDKVSDRLVETNPELKNFKPGENGIYHFIVGEAGGNTFVDANQAVGFLVQGIIGYNMFMQGTPSVVAGSLKTYSLSIPGTHNMPIDNAGFDSDVGQDIKIAYSCINEIMDRLNEKAQGELGKTQRKDALKDIETLATKCNELVDLTQQAAGTTIKDIQLSKAVINAEAKRYIRQYTELAYAGVGLDAAAAAATIGAAMIAWFPGVGLAMTIAAVAATAAAMAVNSQIPGRYKAAIEYIRELSGHFASHENIGPLGKLNKVVTECHSIVNKYGPAASVNSGTFAIISQVFQNIMVLRNTTNPNEKKKSYENFIMDMYFKDRVTSRDGIRIGMIHDSLKTAAIAEWVALGRLPDTTNPNPEGNQTLADMSFVQSSFTSHATTFVALNYSFFAGGSYFFSAKKLYQGRVRAYRTIRRGPHKGFSRYVGTHMKTHSINVQKVSMAGKAAAGLGIVMGIMGLIKAGADAKQIKIDGKRMEKEVEDILDDLVVGYEEMSKALNEEGEDLDEDPPLDESVY